MIAQHTAQPQGRAQGKTLLNRRRDMTLLIAMKAFGWLRRPTRQRFIIAFSSCIHYKVKGLLTQKYFIFFNIIHKYLKL
jgi:hypothetical protein